MFDIAKKEINIHVVGIGGCGGNAVSNIAVNTTEPNLRFTLVNTDVAALNQQTEHQILLIGEQTTRGFGAGADPEEARQAAIESKDLLFDLIREDTVLIIIAGLGGGTGSGATSVLLDIANDADLNTLCFVTLPFTAEGKQRNEIAEKALVDIKSKANATLVMSNDALIAALDKTVGLLSAFKHCDLHMQRVVSALITMLTSTGYINVDINDFSHILSLQGNSALGVGVADSDDTLSDALLNAVQNPLVKATSISGAKGVIVQLTCQQEPSLLTYENMLAELQNQLDDTGSLIISGVTIEPELPHPFEVLVVATGIPGQESNAIAQPESDNVITLGSANTKQHDKQSYLDIPAFVRQKEKF